MNPSLICKAEVPILSYLSHFEAEFKRIKIIYSKKPSITSDFEDIQVPIQTDSKLDNSLNECDLTGDPLKVDLGGNDDSILIKVEEVINNWSKDEAKYYPLSIRDARRELNKILKNSKNESEQDLPNYAICDGKDSHQTVLLGFHGHSFTNYCLEILNIISKNDAATEVDNMVKYHVKACNNNSVKINYITKMNYNIYGRNLRNISNQNASMRNFDYHANVTINVSCNEGTFKANDGRNANMMMNLQLVAGHRLLSINFLWQEMHLLQSYLDILLDNNIHDNTIMCKNALESDEILRRLEKLVETRFLRFSSEKNEPVDLAHLREGDQDFLDELWNILKYCENASTLRNSLHFLFEEITKSNNRSIMIRDKTSNIAQLIEGILTGKMILSAITFNQSVELLFELGAYRLKHDFQAILSQFSSTVKTNIDRIWKSFFQKLHLPQNKSRTTRITQLLQHSQFDMNTKQLAYLSQLYVGAEFIYIIKEQVTLQENIFYYLCECVEKEFINNSTKYIDFLEIFQSPLCEMSLQLDSKNISIIQNLLPSNWTTHMSSKVGGSTIVTMYNLSESSLFPPCIYDYDVPSTEGVYFMARMKKIKGLF